MFGKDNEGLGALVHKAITSAPIDLRKAMARNIYLSGGATRTKGLAARLTSELEALLPRSCAVSVHEGQYREHAAYRGAAVVASLDNFEAICVDQVRNGKIYVTSKRRWRCCTDPLMTGFGAPPLISLRGRTQLYRNILC